MVGHKVFTNIIHIHTPLIAARKITEIFFEQYLQLFNVRGKLPDRKHSEIKTP